MYKHILSVFLFFVSIMNCHSQQNRNRKYIEKFEHRVDSLIHVYNLPGVGLGISKDESVVLNSGFGFANREKKIPVTADTPFRIASLTKPIFTTVLLHLEELGKVNLDWQIKDYVPNYKERCERILEYFNKEMPEYTFLLNDYHPERDDILIKHHLSHTAEKIPGMSYKYNGLLFGMLSDVVETATKSNFDTWVNSLIINRLGLEHSASSQLDVTKSSMLSQIAVPYTIQSDTTFAISDFPDKELNAGAGMVSSVNDLLKFDQALNSGKLIPKESRDRMFTPFRLTTGKISPYGYGWFIQKYRGYTVIWHYGSQPNAYSGLYIKVMEKNLTLVMLANSDGLSKTFDLGNGDVTRSPFAKAFLDTFLMN